MLFCQLTSMRTNGERRTRRRKNRGKLMAKLADEIQISIRRKTHFRISPRDSPRSFRSTAADFGRAPSAATRRLRSPHWNTSLFADGDNVCSAINRLDGGRSESKLDKRQPLEISIFPAPLIEPEVKSGAINGKENVVRVYQVIICGRLPQTRTFNVTVFSLSPSNCGIWLTLWAFAVASTLPM